MGLLSILLGLALFGVLADFLVENDETLRSGQQYVLFNHPLDFSVPILVVCAFAIGLVAMLLILSGIRRMRHKSHRQLQARITRLENENASFVTKENLPNVIPTATTERLAPRRPSQPPPSEPADPRAPGAPQPVAASAPATETVKTELAANPAPVAAQAAAPVAAEKPAPAKAAEPAPKAAPKPAPKVVEEPVAAEVVEEPEVVIVEETPVIEPIVVPTLPPAQAAEKRAALARTAAAKKIAAPDVDHDAEKPAVGYEDPPPSIQPETFLDWQREIAAKADADTEETPKPARSRAKAAAAKPAPAPDPEPARAPEPEPERAPEPKPEPTRSRKKVVVVPEAEEEEEPSLARTRPPVSEEESSVPATWEWP